MDLDKAHKVPDLARREGQSPDKIYRAIANGDLVAYRVSPRDTRVFESDYYRWVRAKRVAPTKKKKDLPSPRKARVDEILRELGR